MANKYDLHYQLLPSLTQVSGKLFSFGFRSAVAVRGPQKLINRWIRIFLTPKGSDPSDRNAGTGFHGLIGSNISGQQDVVDAMTLFIEDCNDQIRASDRRSQVPDDERLQSATLAQIVQNGDDAFEIYIHIRNAAGLTVAVPLPVV